MACAQTQFSVVALVKASADKGCKLSIFHHFEENSAAPLCCQVPDMLRRNKRTYVSKNKTCLTTRGGCDTFAHTDKSMFILQSRRTECNTLWTLLHYTEIIKSGIGVDPCCSFKWGVWVLLRASFMPAHGSSSGGFKTIRASPQVCGWHHWYCQWCKLREGWVGVCVRVEGRRGEKRSHTREREREKDLSVWFRRLSTYKKKTNRDSENLPRVTRLGSDRLGSAVIFGLGLLDF